MTLIGSGVHGIGATPVLSTAKVRGGKNIERTVMQMVSQPMPEGGEIGVMRLASDEQAINAYSALMAQDLQSARVDPNTVAVLGE
jgi:hypothetical protein